MLAFSVLKKCGLKELTLNVNNIGCPACREKYNQALKEYFAGKKLCETCQSRLERNPMRILDCKDVDCGRDADKAPIILDYICDECKDHFEFLKQILDSENIEYKVNPRIVRGLDYYTKTVFEITALVDGASLTVCGGGRYDGLVNQIGDKQICGIGFGMGIERLLLLMQQEHIDFNEEKIYDVFVVSGSSHAERIKAFSIANKLREKGVRAECDHNARSFKAQFKYADKLKVNYTIIVGENELASGRYALKNFATGEQQQLSEEEIIKFFEV